MIKRLLKSCAAALALALATTSATAQTDFPRKPVKLVVAAAAGSSPDAIARRLADKLGATWKQPVVIENVAGLGGITGTERVVRAPGDGYTLVVSTIGAVAIGPSIMNNMPYDPVKDLEPVSLLMSMPNLLVVHPSVPVSSVAELIAYAKQNPDKLRYGHPGIGTSPHLAGELLNLMAGIRMQGVPYKSSAQMMTDLIAGHYEVLFHNASVVLPHAQNNAARVLGITSAQRSSAVPDIPAMAETAALKGFEVSAWWGLYAPAGTPANVVDQISADVGAALRHPDIQNWVEKQTGTIGGGTPQALRQHQAEETTKWRELIKRAGIKAE